MGLAAHESHVSKTVAGAEGKKSVGMFQLKQTAGQQFLWFTLVDPIVMYNLDFLIREGGALVLVDALVFLGAFGFGCLALSPFPCRAWRPLRAPANAARHPKAAERHVSHHGVFRNPNIGQAGACFNGFLLTRESIPNARNDRMRQVLQAKIVVVRFQLVIGVLGLIVMLGGCSTAEINGQIDAVNRALYGSDASRPVSADGSATLIGNASSGATSGSVNFRRRAQGGADILRPAVDDGAMQLRVGEDFMPRPSVDNAMPYQWSASCDMFYLVSAHLPNWNPPADRLSKFSFEDACTLNEAGLALRHSALDDPIRRRPSPRLNTSFGLSDTLQQWRPVFMRRKAEVADFQGKRYFFVGVMALDVHPYNREKHGFFISIDLNTGYGWDKPLVLVGKQLSNQRFNVQLKTDDALARLIDDSRSSNARMPAQRVSVEFKLNGVRALANRIELDVTLEKVQIAVYCNTSTPPVVFDVV